MSVSWSFLLHDSTKSFYSTKFWSNSPEPTIFRLYNYIPIAYIRTHNVEIAPQTHKHPLIYYFLAAKVIKKRKASLVDLILFQGEKSNAEKKVKIKYTPSKATEL